MIHWLPSLFQLFGSQATWVRNGPSSRAVVAVWQKVFQPQTSQEELENLEGSVPLKNDTRFYDRPEVPIVQSTFAVHARQSMIRDYYRELVGRKVGLSARLATPVASPTDSEVARGQPTQQIDTDYLLLPQ